MGKKKRRIPGSQWLSARLSRKMILTLLVVAVLGWGLTCGWFLLYLRGYVGGAYDETLGKAREQAQQATAFLEGSQGDLSGLGGYLAQRGLRGLVWDAQGNVLLGETSQQQEGTRIAATTDTCAILPGGQRLFLRVWEEAPHRDTLINAIGRQGFVGLLVFSGVMVALNAVLLYVVLVAPIVSLRKTMRAYYERGAKPERSERSDEIGKLQNTFAELVGVLETKEKGERQLIASISHDIKTPLTSVMGFSERLVSAKLPPEKQQQYLHSIYDKALHIQSVVEEFDDYIEVGLRDDQPRKRMTAGELCDDLREEYEVELWDANVQLSVSCTCPNAVLLCNPDHMRRYFGNLIGNSIQHSGAHRLELTVHCRQEEGNLVLEFGDNGKGVESEMLQQIFEPLYTSDRGRKVSGLGLSICKGIIQCHGGTILAENRPGGGLLVRATLPLVTN